MNTFNGSDLLPDRNPVHKDHAGPFNYHDIFFNNWGEITVPENTKLQINPKDIWL